MLPDRLTDHSCLRPITHAARIPAGLEGSARRHAISMAEQGFVTGGWRGAAQAPLATAGRAEEVAGRLHRVGRWLLQNITSVSLP